MTKPGAGDGPLLDERGGVTFRYGDAPAGVVAVRLVQEVVHGLPDPELARRRGGGFELRFVPAGVDRFEYRFDLVHADGGHELVCDPHNPLRATGPFGDRSVVEMAGYVPPDWLDVEAPAGDVRELTVPSGVLGEDQPALLWAPPGSPQGAALPLLLVLDGFELERYSGLTRMLEALTAQRRLPPLRALLLPPTSRTDHYSADPRFTEALWKDLLPAVETEAGGRPPALVGLGASLGGLALVHAHRHAPDHGGAGFDGLFLQSSTFLRRPLDGFDKAERVTSFVAEAAAGAGRPVPVEMTSGVVEETFGDNRAMARALQQQGFPARLHALRDAHNWIAWRDGWAHLPSLFEQLVPSEGVAR